VPFLNFDMSSLNYKFKMFSTVTQALNESDIDIKLKIDANYKQQNVNQFSQKWSYLKISSYI